MYDLSLNISPVACTSRHITVMPYSKSLGLIFVAIPKTGTTSLTRALRYLQQPQGEPLQLVKEQITGEYRKIHRLDEIGDRKPGWAKHLSALQIKYILGDDEFNRCLKFSVVRNPWARMVSRYFFTHVDSEPSAAEKRRRGTSRNFQKLDFESWIRLRWKRYKKGRRVNSQLHKLTDLDGQILVDHIGRLESVQDTLDWVTQEIGVDRIEMPYVNGTRKGHYTRFYTRHSREMVEEMCRQDIEYFNYQFDA